MVAGAQDYNESRGFQTFGGYKIISSYLQIEAQARL